MKSYFKLFKLLLGYVSGFVFLGACEAPRYDVEMLAYDPATDQMVLQVNTVETLDDINLLEGRATRIRGGVSVEIHSDGTVKWKNKGNTVAFNAVKLDGVYYPADYDSLAMISVYYNIEQAMLFFESIGMPEGELGRLDTFYWADVLDKFSSETETELLVNNAMYMAVDAFDRGFYVVPFELNQMDTPNIALSMNPGVIAHEYTHAVFQSLVNDRLPDVLQFSTFDPAYYQNSNYYYGLNEGVADMFAVAFTGDPDFMRPSINHAMIVRNANEKIIYNEWMDRNAAGRTVAEFNPYEIGAFISATIYEIARRINGLVADGNSVPDRASRLNVAEKTYNTLKILGESAIADFVPSDFFSIFLGQLASEEKTLACQVLQERFEIHYTEVEGCP